MIVETKIFQGKNDQEVARRFSLEIDRIFKESVSTASKTEEDLISWRQRIDEEAMVIREHAYSKILRIINDAWKKENQKYFKHFWGIRINIIRITNASGFFEDLSTTQKVRIPENVEYVIRMDSYTILKRESSAVTIL